MTLTQSHFETYRRQYPDHFLVFRVSPAEHVVWHPGERSTRTLTPGEADVAILKAAGEGVPVLVGEPVVNGANLGGRP